MGFLGFPDGFADRSNPDELLRLLSWNIHEGEKEIGFQWYNDEIDIHLGALECQRSIDIWCASQREVCSIKVRKDRIIQTVKRLLEDNIRVVAVKAQNISSKSIAEVICDKDDYIKCFEPKDAGETQKVQSAGAPVYDLFGAAICARVKETYDRLKNTPQLTI